LINPENESNEALKRFISLTNKFVVESMNYCSQFVKNLQPGLKHHSMHCISITDNFESLCGLSLEGFGRLFGKLNKNLKDLFPNCPSILERGESSLYCENRFKLFLCLFRLKTGCSLHVMEPLFGWSVASLHSWFSTIIPLLEGVLSPFHEGIFESLGCAWQYQQLEAWKFRHIHLKNDIKYFVDRINIQNKTAEFPINLEEFQGSVGAVDGTFSIRPPLQNRENPTADRFYTDYIKSHAWKLMVVASHGIIGPKLILSISISPGSCSDSLVYRTLQLNTFHSKLVKGAVLLGDQAFISIPNIITPYTPLQLETEQSALLPEKQHFNYSHSQDRMSSEHGIGKLKEWGVIRGRTDCRLFEDFENFEKSVKVKWGLHNFKMLGYPLFL
jgi:hypothetical protein